MNNPMNKLLRNTAITWNPLLSGMLLHVRDGELFWDKDLATQVFTVWPATHWLGLIEMSNDEILAEVSRQREASDDGAIQLMPNRILWTGTKRSAETAKKMLHKIKVAGHGAYVFRVRDMSIGQEISRFLIAEMEKQTDDG